MPLTDNDGHYVVYGLVGPVRLRVLSDGFELIARDAVVNGHATLDFNVPGGLP
jgi:hypothetical protein